MRHVLLRLAAIGPLVMLAAGCAVTDASYGYGSYGGYYQPYPYYGYGPVWGGLFAFGPSYGGYYHHHRFYHNHPAFSGALRSGFPGSLGFRPNPGGAFHGGGGFGGGFARGHVGGHGGFAGGHH